MADSEHPRSAHTAPLSTPHPAPDLPRDLSGRGVAWSGLAGGPLGPEWAPGPREVRTQAWSARAPARPPHLVQEAHEVAEDGVVVFWKVLQDLAAAGHPQAALHTCHGPRVLPERPLPASLSGRAGAWGEGDRLPHAWASGPFPSRSCGCSQQPPASPSSACFFTSGTMTAPHQTTPGSQITLWMGWSIQTTGRGSVAYFCQ